MAKDKQDFIVNDNFSEELTKKIEGIWEQSERTIDHAWIELKDIPTSHKLSLVMDRKEENIRNQRKTFKNNYDPSEKIVFGRFKDQGNTIKMVDGYTRFVSCTLENIEKLTFRIKDFKSEESAIDWIYNNQVIRRNIDDKDKLKMVLRMMENPETKVNGARVAKIFDMGAKSGQRIYRVAKMGTEVMIQKVLDGEMSINQIHNMLGQETEILENGKLAVKNSQITENTPKIVESSGQITDNATADEKELEIAFSKSDHHITLTKRFLGKMGKEKGNVFARKNFKAHEVIDAVNRATLTKHASADALCEYVFNELKKIKAC